MQLVCLGAVTAEAGMSQAARRLKACLLYEALCALQAIQGMKLVCFGAVAAGARMSQAAGRLTAWLLCEALCATQAIQGMKLVCMELSQLEQAEAEGSPEAAAEQLPPATARLLRDSACSLVLDLCQQLHQVGPDLACTNIYKQIFDFEPLVTDSSVKGGPLKA